MAAPINDVLVWAEQDVNLPNTGRANKVKPSLDVSNKGYDKGQKPAAEEFNWVLNNLGEWVRYLKDERIPELEEETDEKLDDLKEEIEHSVQPFLVPVGGILLWPGVVPPSGWLELNGQAFDLTQNPKLALLYPSGFLPDWRGRFVRAWAHGSLLDPDSNRENGSFQEDMLKSHKHSIIMSMEHGGRNAGQGYPSTDDSGPHVVHDESQPDLSWSDRSGAGNPLGSFGGEETRPINVAAMYIVKSDLADIDPEDPAPTGIILSPSSISQSVGYSVIVTAQVIPSSLAPNFPVTFSSSDNSVFTVNANTGQLTLVGPGTATLIAEISTGLTSTMTVNSYVVSTGLSLSAPNVNTGDTDQVIVTRTPVNSNEPLVYVSSNTDVVVVAQDGTISGVGAGTALITVTGSISGVSGTDSVTVTDPAPEVPDLYAVGSYIVGTTGGTVAPGATVSGNALYIRSAAATHNQGGSKVIVGVGTWRMLGGLVIDSTKEGELIRNCNGGALFLRIA